MRYDDPLFQRQGSFLGGWSYSLVSGREVLGSGRKGDDALCLGFEGSSSKLICDLSCAIRAVWFELGE